MSYVEAKQMGVGYFKFRIVIPIYRPERYLLATFARRIARFPKLHPEIRPQQIAKKGRCSNTRGLLQKEAER